ncbi:MAG: xanthine dehydrogenase family protein subunit M [Candidatus Promineifilaceae bacterium]|nr:xanthine dehydrogenase family protein subunit M [Candidatus Promineifilaceae bacterium]
MYPPKFDYYRANSVEEALALLQEHDGKLLAGGHSLLPIMKLRLADPGVLIDIGRIESLQGLSPANGHTRIGALTTHAMVAASNALPDVLVEAAGWIGDPQVRNRGTVGGNIAHADPASDLPTVLAALDAVVEVQGPNGSREVNAADFFVDLFMTDLQPNEIVTGVRAPGDGQGTGSAFAKLFNPASRYAMVNAAAVLTMDGDRCTEAKVAVGGLTPSAMRAPSVEEALQGRTLDEKALAEAAEAVHDDLPGDLLGDIHASADYRRKVAPTFVRRALLKAMERAG